MRKQYKQKNKSCAICKPHKMHWANRWKAKYIAKSIVDEKSINEALSDSVDGFEWLLIYPLR